MKHTQGKWTFDEQELIMSDKGQVIADICPCNGEGEPLDAVMPPAERIANGKLIAAAPIMLDALVRLIEDDGMSTCLGDGWNEKIQQIILNLS